jgi:hypothetical protein
VINWSTAFGYFDDATNRAVLEGIVRVLRPGGRLAIDLDNLTAFLASYCPSRVVAARENGDTLVDRYHLDALTGRFEADRTVIRSGGRNRRSTPLNRGFRTHRVHKAPRPSLTGLPGSPCLTVERGLRMVSLSVAGGGVILPPGVRPLETATPHALLGTRRGFTGFVGTTVPLAWRPSLP